MRGMVVACVLMLSLVTAAAAQRKPAPGAPATLAIMVTDAAGAVLSNVTVTLHGAEKRTARTESGRAVFENVPAGEYRLHFEREGFVPLEKELAARGGKPVDVKVTLTPLPPPPPPPAAPEKPTVDAKPMAADVPAVIETEFIGKAPSRATPLACGGEGTATLIQLREPLADHAHRDADEFFYVVAGEGTARVGTGQQKLKAGVFLFVPAGMEHGLTPAGRNPLIVLSTLAGEPCR